MEIYQVRYFLALCETLNFTRAAEKCNVSQPSLTRAIQTLEAEFGGPLFHRERQNTHLTHLGRMVRPYLEETWAQAQEAKVRAKAFAVLADVDLNLGLMCTLGPTRLVGLMEHYRLAHPNVSLCLRDANAETLRGLLDGGELDVAVLALPHMDDHFHALPLFSEGFVIAVAPGHRFESMEAIALADLHQECYLRRTNCEFGTYFHEVLSREGVEPSCIYRSDREDWIQVMALAGLGFAIVPEFSLTVPGLVTRPLVEPLTRTVNLVTVRGRPHSPAVGAFVRHAVSHKWAA